MNHKRLSVGLVATLLFASWLFFGIEERPREHGTDYDFFAKQEPRFRVLYRNPAVCGECDVEPLATLTANQQAALADFCQVRFGLDNVRVCYAIFLEKQRMADERRHKGGVSESGKIVR